MLAQNFKTADELQVTDQEHSALIAVLGMLERQELAYTSDPNPALPNAFNMNWCGLSHDCGSAACIGGWVARIAKLGAGVEYVEACQHRPVGRLYWPHSLQNRKSWELITTTQAAVALRNFLTTGHPRWREAVRS